MPLHRLSSEHRKLPRRFLSSHHFSDTTFEMTRLTFIFNQLSVQTHHQLTREDFRDFLSSIFNLNDQTIIERLFLLLGQGEKSFSLKEFLSIMHLLLFASYDEQMKFIFRIYDLSADGNLQREELFTFLRKDFTSQNDKEDTEMILHEFITLILKKFDRDQDGVISFDDYSRTCQENPTLLECFGQIYPSFFRKQIIRTILNGNRSLLEKKDWK